MAVNWSWKIKKGEFTFKSSSPEGNKYKVNFYGANCLGALIYDFKEDGKDMYQFIGFWNDIQHLKNCLGLSKGYKENIYKEQIVKVKLNTYFKDNLKIADCFSRVGVKVELYYKEIK